jgi:hypothetical protein
MDAWLKAHAFFVTAISGAIYIAGGDCHRLSEDKATVALMAKGVVSFRTYTSSFQYSLTSYFRTSSTHVVFTPRRGMSRL